MKAFTSSKLFHFLSLFFLPLLLIFNAVLQADAHAYFVFGDSIVDHGNNNYLFTFARADMPPYGVDYPPSYKPTGRFSNGLTIADIIGEYFNFPPLHPYLSPNMTGYNLLHGANFASAGVGILEDTGMQFYNVIKVKQQLKNFREYQHKMKRLIGPEKTRKLIRESLTLISLGGNDWVNNYFLIPHSLRSLQFDVHSYSHLLITEYQKILRKLHKLGARMIIVTGTGPLGCVPGTMALNSDHGECVKKVQEASFLFNDRLTYMLNRLNIRLSTNSDPIFIASDINSYHMDIISNPEAYGFETSSVACCGLGPYNGLGPCTRFSNLCEDRDKYVFWDAYHPTERANKFIAEALIYGTTKHIQPMNLSTIKAKYFIKFFLWECLFTQPTLHSDPKSARKTMIILTQLESEKLSDYNWVRKR